MPLMNGCLSMIMNSIELLLRAIQNGILLGPNTFEDLEAEEVLSGRDDPMFEDEWLRLYEEVKDTSLTEDEARRLDALREAAFKTAFKYCSDPDLSAYISDDFEVMARGVASHPEESFLAALIEAYSAGRIPHGIITHSGRPLQSLLDALQS
jgi:hypothetical protein